MLNNEYILSLFKIYYGAIKILLIYWQKVYNMFELSD